MSTQFKVKYWVGPFNSWALHLEHDRRRWSSKRAGVEQNTNKPIIIISMLQLIYVNLDSA